MACSNPDCTYSTCRMQTIHDTTLATMRHAIADLETALKKQPVKILVGGTVAAHFYKAFGVASTDDSLNELDTDSNCGQDCVKVIDRAKALLESITEAHGDKSKEGRDLIAMVDDVCQVFWRG